MAFNGTGWPWPRADGSRTLNSCTERCACSRARTGGKHAGSQSPWPARRTRGGGVRPSRPSPDADALIRAAQRVVELRVTELEEEIAGTNALLERFPFGVILLDASGRFRRANHHAQRLLRERDGLATAPGGLRAARPEDTAKLRRLVARAAEGEGREGVLVLRRPSGRRAL